MSPVLTQLVLCAALAVGLSACAPGERAAEEASVRAFVRSVATDVSRDGPAAWAANFAVGPEFFMASDGRVVFADGAAAARGVEALTHELAKLDLRFGDLRVDVLTPELAVVGAPHAEVQTDAAGAQHTESGYFTGLAQRSEGRWRFRSAHWSSHP